MIPAFGIIIGIVLIFYAVFSFKSPRLFFTILATMLIGIGIMIADNNHLKHELEYGEDAAAAFSIIAADEIDIIVKKLEVYKLHEGQYPDSLEQLKMVFPEISIMDPLLGRNPKPHKSINYYYKRSGEKYILFSAGIDGIPNTQDDIYPRKPLRSPDSTKKN